jgi:hypothetical protein
MSKKEDSAAYGMDLRDYFAAAAMQGFLSNSDHDPNVWQLASDAYKVADIMLQVRTEK